MESSFIKNDYDILNKFFSVDFIPIPNKKIDWIKFVFVAYKKTRQSDITFSWFAGVHASISVFFSKLFKKKSVVVVGGYDAAYFPDKKYGAFTSLKEKIPALYVFNNVDRILVVDPSLKNGIIKNTKITGDNIYFCPTCYDYNYWNTSNKKEDVVLTVAIANDIQTVKLKGLDVFVKSARYIQSIKFILIGISGEAEEYLKSIATGNVEIIGFLKKDDLLRYFQKSKVYCQLSFDEGLPNALCEAMLCGCIPVGSNINGVKSAVGDTGFYVEYGDVKGTVDMIKKALNLKYGLGDKSRERIKDLFPCERRDKELVKNIIDEVNNV